MLNDLSFDRLVAFAAGELDAEAAALVTKRLAQTPDGAARLSLARKFVDSARNDRTAAAPVELMQSARSIFRAPPAPLSRALGDLRDLVATLLFDSRIEPALVGFRGADDGFQVAYAAEDAEVELDFNPVTEDLRDAWQMMGQVTVRTGGGRARVAVVPRGGSAAILELESDEHGVFSGKLAPGGYDVTITLADGVVRIPTLDVP